MVKVEMKINRFIKHIGKDDLIMNNGSIIQVVTQNGFWSQWSYCSLQMGRKQFSHLKKHGLIFVDKEKTDKANEKYKSPFLTYYRFDVDKLIKSGYPIVKD